MDGGTWEGEWWLPGQPENAVTGTLSLDGSEFALVTDGILDPPEFPDASDVVYTTLWESRHHAAIHGTLADGRPATLLEAHGLATAAPVSAVTERWNPRAALLGCHVNGSEDGRFVCGTVRIEHLRAFAGEPRVGMDLTWQQSTGALARVALEAERRVLFSAALPAATVEVVAVPELKTSDAGAEVAVQVVTEVALPSAADWRAVWQQYVLPLRDLVCVLLGRSAAVQSVVLRTLDGEAVQLLLRLPEPLQPQRQIRAHDFVVTAAQLPGGFDAALNAWWLARERRRVAVREVVDVLNAPHVYVDDRLLAYVRAIGPLLNESEKKAATEHAASEDAAWKERVAAALPDELRDGVLARLGDKAPSDRQRLVALICALDPAGSWLAGDDPDLFAQAVIATRGELTHPSSNPNKKALTGEGLVAHTRALGWIVLAALLRDIGMTTEEIRAAVDEAGGGAAAAAVVALRALPE